MKIFILVLFVQIGINSVYCTYIGNFFTSNYDKLNDEMKEIRTYINYLENKLNYTENLIKVINITNKPMKDEIQNEVHRRMGIFNSKINNTSHHNYQIETKLNNFEELISKKVEHLITNRSYQIYEDLSKQLNNIYNETMAYCETTRIEELSQIFNLDIQFDKLQINLLKLRNETLDGFNNVTKNYQLNNQSEIFQNEINKIQLKYNNLAGELPKLQSKFQVEINQINFKLNNQSDEITKLHSKNNNLMNIISQLLLKFDKMDQNFKNVVTSSTTEQVYGVWRPVTTKKAGLVWVRPPL